MFAWVGQIVRTPNVLANQDCHNVRRGALVWRIRFIQKSLPRLKPNELGTFSLVEVVTGHALKLTKVGHKGHFKLIITSKFKSLYSEEPLN